MKKRGSILALLLVVTLIGFCSTTPPKREMRSAWLATVWRIDWPKTAMTSVTATNINKQKNELITILDSVKAANMNAIFFQVRPEADALYQSAYEPWSAHLGGARGTYPGYDPLAFAIEEAHKRGIELHAWLNPYRFESVSGKYSGKSGDYRASHPEWILDYSDITILDPGNPGVRKLIKNIVGDILSKYDVDGIVFDDYFYAYGGTSPTLDSYSQNLYKPANMSLADWRRDNINKMISDVYDTIQAVKPYVTFGVSPFGIWTTRSEVAQARGLTLPQGITGLDAYNVIYCDPVAWLEQGKVDYISPQLYWTTTTTRQDYDVLCPWWSDVAYRYGKHFYSSMSLSDLSSTYQVRSSSEENVDTIPSNLHELKKYMLNGGLTTGLTRTEMRIISSVAFDDSEIGLQIDRNRLSTKNAAPGHVFYSVKHLVTNGKFTKYLREQKFTSPALTPAIGWKTHPALTPPTNVTRTGNTLSWSYSGSNVRFAVYAIPNSQVGNAAAFENINNLLGTTYAKQFDVAKYSSLYSTHTFFVSTIDRYGNEFLPVESAPVDPTDTPQLTQLWEFSTQKGNLGTATDDVKNGFAISNDGTKLYLGTRASGSNQVAIYNASTGARTGYLPALSGFYAQYGGDVAVDDNGAIYACNVITGSGALQVAKWDGETDASPQIIISTTSHGGDGTYRIGYGMDVKIDASGNGFILMHKGGTSDFKIWKVSGGTPVSQNPTTITATPAITDAYARISIVDNNHFWVDGNAEYPYYGTITWSGGNPTSISLQVINPNGDLLKGVGGATEFSLGGERYLVAARNNHGTTFTDKHSALLKQLEATGVGITNQNVLGTPLPPNGLGSTSDGSHFVESNIYINGNTAYIYLMGGFNGITCYKISFPAATKIFTVTVPRGTEKVYIAGSFIEKDWDIDDPYELTPTGNPNEFSGSFPCTDDIEYKYLCEKGSWEYQEAGNLGTIPYPNAQPAEHGKRTYNANDVVNNWKAMPKIVLNVGFQEGLELPTQLFVKGSWDNWTNAIPLTKISFNPSAPIVFKGTLGGNPGDKIYANTAYKYYTNDGATENWELSTTNRWTTYPQMNDVIIGFETSFSNIGQLEVEELWEFSVQKGNLGNAASDVQNGFAISKNGTKLYLGTRNNGADQIAVYNASTGIRTSYLPALSGFYAQYGGDVAVDDNGAIYACNVIISETGVLQVARWANETDASPQIIISTTSHGGDGTCRIGYGMDVKIDASGNGFILMHKGVTSDFKIWKISNGTPTSQNPITVTATPTIADGLSRIFIVDNNHFWMDGNENYPFYGTITWSGGTPTSISLQVINPEEDLYKKVGGATEFILAGKRYLVAARNNHSTTFTDKHSVLLKQLETGTAIINQNVLSTPLPINGLGGTTDNWHFVESNVHVNSSTNTAYLYLMGGANGIAAYKLTAPDPATLFVPEKVDYQILPTPTGVLIQLNKVSRIEIYNINGMLIDKKETTGTYTRDLNHGIYIIRIDGKATKFVK